MSLLPFHQVNPNKKPEWRYARVLALTNARIRESFRDDAAVKEWLKFFRKYQETITDEPARERLYYKYPGQYIAQKIYEAGDDTSTKYTTFAIQTRILAGQSNEEIAHIAKTIPSGIDWYEKIFFNVRPHLDNRDWIIQSVYLPAKDKYDNPDSGNDQVIRVGGQSSNFAVAYVDPTIQLLSYGFGPFAADYLLSWVVPGKAAVKPSTATELQKAMHEQLRMALTTRSLITAQSFPINKYNAIEAIKLAQELQNMQLAAKSATTDDEYEDSEEAVFFKAMDAVLRNIPQNTVTTKRLADSSAAGVDLDPSAGTVEPRLTEVVTDDIIKERRAFVAQGRLQPGSSHEKPAEPAD